MDAGELIVLGRELSAIGAAVMRGARLPGGAVPSGISMIGADVLAHTPTSVGEIADRTGLRRDYVSESVGKLRDQGIVDTAPDPRDGHRTLVRLTARNPEQVSPAAAAPADQALRDALGPGADGETAATILAALTDLAGRLRPARDTQEPGAEEPAAPVRGERDLRPRAGIPRPGATPADATRADATRIDVDATRADATRADVTRADRTRADRTRAESTRVNRPARRHRKGGRGGGGSIR